MTSKPYFYTEPATKHDVIELFPAIAGKGGFETAEQASHYSDNHLKYLEGKYALFDNMIRRKVERCEQSEEPCGKVICATCSRQYRRWLFSQSHQHYLHSRSGTFRSVTVYIEDVPQHQLHNLNLARHKARIRKKLERLKLDGLQLLGGIEIAWREENKDWRVHAHILVHVKNEHEISIVSEALRNESIDKSVRVDEIKNKVQQISYLQKFAMIHSPKDRNGQRRNFSYPLPLEAGQELCRFYLRHNFENFLFLAGFRRRGCKIVPS